MKFEPSDFSGSGDYASCALAANAKLREWLASAPVVYGNGTQFDISKEPSQLEIANGVTHSARLVDIQELKKEPCNHEPTFVYETGAYTGTCRYCGAKLKAEWRAE